MKERTFFDITIVFTVCICLALLFKSLYSSTLSREKEIHSSGEYFLHVTAKLLSYDSDRIRDDDGDYVRVYDCKYVYVVNDSYYYMELDDCYNLNETKKIYYDPSNPEIYSFYATYQQAVDEHKVDKFLSDLFFGISFVLLLIIIYFYIFRKQYLVTGYRKITDDDIKIDKPYIVDEYGVWDADDENYVDVDTRLNRTVVQVPDKEVVDEIATIKFETKHNTDISADINDKNI